MAILYLESDDEITSAAARIRSAEDVDVAVVLPAGSRIATSRINFRLLAREAAGRGRRLSIVAPEASARALAASAGLPVFASVVELEEARGTKPAAPEAAPPSTAPAAAAQAAVEGKGEGGSSPGRGRFAASPPITRPPGPDVRGLPGRGPERQPGTPPGASPRSDGPAHVPPGEGRPGPDRPAGASVRGSIGPSTGLGAPPLTAPAPRRRWPLVAAVLLAALLVLGTGATVGYVLLPTATVTLALESRPVGPVSFVGTADPGALAVDAATATIPAVRVEIPISAAGSFPATGTRVESTPASGQVRWTNCDPTRAYTLPRGTVARTPGGIAFRTAEAVFLPVAILDPPRITCQNRVVDVRAAKDGPEGNVAAGAITVIPGDYNSVVIKVANPAPTSGGTREEFPQVAEKDVTTAIAALTKQLDAQLAALAADPPGAPAGAIVYPETARRGEAQPSEPTAEIVGREAASFDLALTAPASVVAVDPGPLQALAEQRVQAAVPEGMALREGSVRVTVGSGAVQGDTVRFPVEARAEAVRSISVDEVRALVKGRTVAEVRRLLAEFGAATATLWPDWAGTITSIDARLTVVIEDLPPAETPAPTPRPTARPTASPATPAPPSPSATVAPTPAP